MSRTKFGKNFTIVPVSASPSEVGASSDEPDKPVGLENLINSVLQMVEIPDRDRGIEKDFLFAIDHCFSIKGQGTVITGTVLAGKAKVGDVIELPALK
jgi:selenocysteine-specific elongation factor